MARENGRGQRYNAVRKEINSNGKFERAKVRSDSVFASYNPPEVQKH